MEEFPLEVFPYHETGQLKKIAEQKRGAEERLPQPSGKSTTVKITYKAS